MLQTTTALPPAPSLLTCILGSICQTLLGNRILSYTPVDKLNFRHALLWETRFIQNNFQQLLRNHPDQFIVVTGSKLLGTAPTWEDATTLGYKKRGLKSFMIHYMREKKPEPAPKIQLIPQTA